METKAATFLEKLRSWPGEPSVLVDSLPEHSRFGGSHCPCAPWSRLLTVPRGKAQHDRSLAFPLCQEHVDKELIHLVKSIRPNPQV